jgi:hypothetical protein
VIDRYHFLTRWRVAATAEEVYDILSLPLDYPRWWPSVYLAARELTSSRVRLRTTGWLPYILRWEAVTTEARRPNLLAIRASGDFDGRGIWSIVQDGEFADITFDWKVNIQKPLLRYLSFALKPAFEANHRWAMQQGRRSLELELARGRVHNMEEMNSIAPAPGPHQFPTRPVVAGAGFRACITEETPIRCRRSPISRPISCASCRCAALPCSPSIGGASKRFSI